MTTSAPPNEGYKRPPITEAVIGITFSSPIDSEQLDSITKKFQSTYPHKKQVSTFDLSVRFDSANPDGNKADFKPTIGHRLSTDDQTQLLVLWPNSFILSQLPPYPGWDAFFQRFEKDWGLLKRTLGFQQINRIGMRYINRIDIPANLAVGETNTTVEHEQFLNIYPKLPDILNPLDAYAVQASIHLNDINCQLTINSASIPSPLLKHISFVIDIDIYSDKDVPQSDSQIMELLNKIRTKKNMIFESCISHPARELFQ
jgi:uncharacterized protein (TIGR04255 family)